MEADDYKKCNHFVIFYSISNGYIELIHQLGYDNKPHPDAVYAMIHEVTHNPEYDKTYGKEYKRDFSVVNMKLDGSAYTSMDDLTLTVIDKLIDNAEDLGLELNCDFLNL